MGAERCARGGGTLASAAALRLTAAPGQSEGPGISRSILVRWLLHHDKFNSSDTNAFVCSEYSATFIRSMITVRAEGGALGVAMVLIGSKKQPGWLA